MPRQVEGVGPDDLARVRDVERHLLGACLWSDLHGSDGFDEAAEVVGPDDFGTHAHRVVFAAMLEMRAAAVPVNAATVFERLRATGAAVELGDAPADWIGDVVTLQAGDVGAAEYAKLVKEASDNRRLKRAVLQMSAVVEQVARPTADQLAECEQLLFDAGSRGATSQRAAPEMARAALERIDRIASGQESPGLATGFTDLDYMLCGLKPGNVIVLAARPSVGKTALSLLAATNASRAGVPTLFVSLEMGEDEIMERVLAMRSGVPLRSLQTGRLDGEDASRVTAAAHAFAREPFHVETATPMSSARLASITRRAVRRDGLKLLVVDYLGLMEPEDLKAPRVHQVGLLSRRMKQLARQCRIPILVLCQLNRESEGRTDGKPKLSDLRDSGEVEQDADVVLLMSRQKNQPQENCVWLIDVDVAKNRGGMTGEVTLAYRRQVVRFENAVA